jgi:hypothetical protein
MAIPSNTGVRASMSKTAREPGEEESKEAAELQGENFIEAEKPQETVSTARARGGGGDGHKKYYKKTGSANQGDKPQSSSRSNNLELWLSKKKALDQ